MSVLQEKLAAHRGEILALAEKYGVIDVKIFGSVARGEDTEQSDIDLLIDLEHPVKDGFSFISFQMAVEELLKRKVDIVFEKGIFPPMRKFIMRDARPL